MLKLVVGRIRSNLDIARNKALGRVDEGTRNDMHVAGLGDGLKAFVDLASNLRVIGREAQKWVIGTAKSY